MPLLLQQLQQHQHQHQNNYKTLSTSQLHTAQTHDDDISVTNMITCRHRRQMNRRYEQQ